MFAEDNQQISGPSFPMCLRCPSVFITEERQPHVFITEERQSEDAVFALPSTEHTH